MAGTKFSPRANRFRWRRRSIISICRYCSKTQRRKAPGHRKRHENNSWNPACTNECMKLLDVRVESAGDRVRITGHIEGATVQPYLAFPREMESVVSDTVDAFVPALLVPC